MAQQSLISLILAVLKDPRVIITAVITFLAMDLSCYVVRYRKKAAPVKKKSFAAPAPVPESSEDDGGDDGDDGGDDEE
ncbi:MAG: hypothetical protein KBT11_01050 [Treponema sp.]|nr:hypothetical protein [Candidatus Treponema equifaecale]